MRIKDELNKELFLIDRELNEQFENPIEEYKVSRNITDEMKEQDQMRWVQEMNDIKNCVQEIIWNEID